LAISGISPMVEILG